MYIFFCDKPHIFEVWIGLKSLTGGDLDRNVRYWDSERRNLITGHMTPAWGTDHTTHKYRKQISTKFCKNHWQKEAPGQTNIAVDRSNSLPSQYLIKIIKWSELGIISQLIKTRSRQSWPRGWYPLITRAGQEGGLPPGLLRAQAKS